MTKKECRSNDRTSDETMQQKRADEVKAELLLFGVVVVAELEFGGDE
jgi:hypothetical protein